MRDLTVTPVVWAAAFFAIPIIVTHAIGAALAYKLLTKHETFWENGSGTPPDGIVTSSS